MIDPKTPLPTNDRMKSERQTIAGNLAWLRTQSRISLSELSRRSGVGKATLSKLEAGQGNPTLETLWAIAGALDVPLGSLLSKDGGARHLARAQDGGWVNGEVLDGRHVDRLLNSAFVELYEIRVRPGRPHRRPGKAPASVDQVYVVEGRLRVGPESDPVELGPGDLLRFASDVPYLFEAIDEPVRALQICSSTRPQGEPGDAGDDPAAAPTD